MTPGAAAQADELVWQRRGAGGAAAVLSAVAVFQVAAVCGAPVGSFTQGGQQPGVLRPAGRALAAGSALLLVPMALVVVGRVGMGPAAGWRPRRMNLAWRGALTIEVATLAANLASRSTHERATFAPVSAVTLVLTLASGHTHPLPHGAIRTPRENL